MFCLLLKSDPADGQAVALNRDSIGCKLYIFFTKQVVYGTGSHYSCGMPLSAESFRSRFLHAEEF